MLSGGGSDVLGMACVFGALQSLLCDKGARQRRLPAKELCHLRRGSDIPGVLEVKLHIKNKKRSKTGAGSPEVVSTFSKYGSVASRRQPDAQDLLCVK